jgi:hypothetical protein
MKKALARCVEITRRISERRHLVDSLTHLSYDKEHNEHEVTSARRHLAIGNVDG